MVPLPRSPIARCAEGSVTSKTGLMAAALSNLSHETHMQEDNAALTASPKTQASAAGHQPVESSKAREILGSAHVGGKTLQRRRLRLASAPASILVGPLELGMALHSTGAAHQ